MDLLSPSAEISQDLSDPRVRRLWESLWEWKLQSPGFSLDPPSLDFEGLQLPPAGGVFWRGLSRARKPRFSSGPLGHRMCPFRWYLLSTYCVSGTILGTEDALMKKTDTIPVFFFL